MGNCRAQLATIRTGERAEQVRKRTSRFISLAHRQHDRRADALNPPTDKLGAGRA
jgi:hypothetical protein